MTIIPLPPDVERLQAEEAQRRGTMPERLTIDCLLQAFQTLEGTSSPQPGSLFDVLSPFVGVVEGSGENLSEQCGARFTEILIERDQ